jgi:acyl-CoA dehydrogenase
MTIDLTVSDDLARYGSELKEWGLSEVRPHARQADIDHALPENYAKIMGTCPVPLSQPGRTSEVAATFADGPGIYGPVFYESVAYGDIWAIEALNNGIAHLVVEAIGTPDQVSRWYTPIIEVGGKTAFGMSEPGVGSDTSRIETTAKT